MNNIDYNQGDNSHVKTRRFSLPERLSEPSRVIILEHIPEKDDELEDSCVDSSCGIPKIMACSRSKSDTSQDKKTRKVLIKKSPPNGGSSAWLIVLASFLTGFCIDGTCFSFGIFYDSFLKHFNSSKGLTSLSGALISGVYQTAGPIASALIHKFGCRKVTIFGGLFTSISLYASTFTTNIYYHLLTYGVLSGIGFGLMYLPAIITVSTYFTSKRSLATGVSLCGSGLGAFFYAPTCQFLMEYLSLQSSICILALIVAFVSVFCGMLQSPLEQVISLVFDEEEEQTGENKTENDKKDKGVKLSKLDEGDDDENSDSKSEEKLSSNRVADEEDKRKNVKRKNNLVVPPVDFGGRGRKNGQRAISECVAPNLAVLEANLSKQYHLDSNDPNSRSTYLYRSKNSLIFKQQDLFYSASTLHLQPHSITNIPQQTSKLNFDDEVISNIVTVKKEVQDTVYQTIKKWLSSSSSDKTEQTDEPITEEKQRKMTTVPKDEEDESALQIVKEMLDISIFKSLPFTLLAMGNFVSMCGFYIPFIYLSQYVEESVMNGTRKTTKSESALLLSYIGITNTISRLFFGYLSDLIKKGTFRNTFLLKHMTVMTLNNYSLLFAGVSVILIPFCTQYYQIILVCLLFGVCIASAICLTSIVLVDLLGLEKLTNSFALIALVRGLGSMIGPPLTGLLASDWTFYLGGIFFIISSALCFLVKVKEKSPTSIENLKLSK